MSQLIEKIKKASSGTAQPMGFRSSRPAATVPKLILIAGLKGIPPENPGDYLEGADALLLRMDEAPPEKMIQKIAKSLGQLPWGLYQDDEKGLIENAVRSGLDFVVFSTAGKVDDVPADKTIGKILEVDSSMDDGLLRTINDLPVDAVLVTDESGSGPLLWHQLMIFQHLANLISKSLIIPTPVDLSADEIKALWEAGVDGILVTADTESPGGFKELRQAIDALPPRARRRSSSSQVILPRDAGENNPVSPPEEDDNEYE